MKVDGSIQSLIQGVSQQPPRTRLPGQCTLQDNYTSNPVDGLSRRPPMDWIGDLFSTANPAQFYHLRQGFEDYLVCASSASLRVFTLDGVEKTVNIDGNSLDYIDGSPLVFTTMENTTYIANTEVVCEMEDEDPIFLDHGVIVYVRGGNYNTTYTLTLNWKDPGASGTPRTVTVSYTTDASAATAINTVHIATELQSALNGSTLFTDNFNVVRVEDVLYINWDGSRTDTFTATAGDTYGNNNMIAVNNSVRTVSQLPRFAPHGYYVVVTGDGSQSVDDYYLEFSVTPDDQGIHPAVGAGFGRPGVWIETVKARIPYLTNWDTMPHILVYDEDTDEFTFSTGEWGDRIVGDEDSNPNPTFIGRTINHLSYFQGRLVILSGPAVCMSKVNKPTDFFAETALRVTNTDPIDIQSTAAGVTQMLRAIPHNRDLVVFADDAQFIVFGRNALTPENASLVLTTAFEANLDADPVAAGSVVFFAIDYGNYTGIREFFTEGSVDINDSRPITQHVLKYIEGKVTHMASSSNFDTLIVQAGNPRHLYVYEYIWFENTRAQSSWSRWILPADVKHFFFVDSVIYVVSYQDGTYILESMDLDTHNDAGVHYQVKLDRKVTHAGVNTTLVNPVPHVTDIDKMVFVQGEDCPYPGMRLMVSDYDAGTGTVTFIEDMQGGSVIAGIPYKSKYTPTMPMVKDAEGVKISTGRLTIKKFLINCRESGGLDVEVNYKYRPKVDLHYTGRKVGDPTTLIGVPAVVDQTFEVPFRDNSDYGELTIWTDRHTPLTIMDIEWIGQYTKRGQRITQGE